jgi:hypothetical protein
MALLCRLSGDAFGHRRAMCGPLELLCGKLGRVETSLIFKLLMMRYHCVSCVFNVMCKLSNYSLQAVAQRVCNGERLGQPERCPDAVFSVMLSCWAVFKERRPTFSNLKQDLHDSYASVSAAATDAVGGRTLCSWCLEQPATMAYVPCGHRCMCEDHAAMAGSQCPICRAVASGVVRIFDS